MAEERVERRLTAILAADVAGYSRLTGSDEEGTLARLKAHRSALVDPKINEHRGRIVRAFFVWAESNSPQEDSQKGGVERVFGV